MHRRNRDEEDLADYKTADSLIDDLIKRMITANENDREANSKSQPAIRKLLMSHEVYAELRKK